MECPDIFLEENQEQRIINLPSGINYKEARGKLMKIFISDINKYYASDFGLPVFGSNVSELIKNSYYHGDALDKGLEFGYFYSPRNIVIGCNDFGDYFTKEDIKEKWENREKIISSGKMLNENNKCVSGNGVGLDLFIYNYYKDLLIDTSQGSFFGRIDLKDRSLI